MRLLEQLDRARYVRFDEAHETVLVWFGGHGCHAYTDTGLEIAYWNIGDFAQNAASFEEVEESFEEHIRTGDYLELY